MLRQCAHGRKVNLFGQIFREVFQKEGSKNKHPFFNNYKNLINMTRLPIALKYRPDALIRAVSAGFVRYD
jgi:hypothetical protein